MSRVAGYPFSAVVGMDELRLALVLCAVSPAVGGVLVRGEKGTAKSTTVRALAALLPDVDVVESCRFSCAPADTDPSCPDGPHDGASSTTRPARLVELPVGAAEERVLGALHLERALSEGVTVYEPGLLAAAHRGVLYVDEVNLLQDHLVDVLLDAAAMGRAVVERDQVSVSHAARFVLVGTMNPEEGELRPQLLDRFGLTVEVAASRDPEVRVEVIRRGLAHEADAAAFAARFSEEEDELAGRIADARALLPTVVLTDTALRQVAEVCAAFDVDGMRADLVTARAAIAHAAWCGRREVTTQDVRVAARLALPHRRRRDPFDVPGLDHGRLDDMLPPDDGGPDDGGPEDGGPNDGRPDGAGPDDGGPGDDPGGGDAGHGDAAPQEGAAPAELTTPSEGTAPRNGRARTGTPYRTRALTVPGVGAGAAGRRSRALSRTGRLVRARRPRAGDAQPDVVSTLRVAAVHQRARRAKRAGGRRVVVHPEDLRVAVREGREGNLVLFCVDASGSMTARRRMDAVASAVLSLLVDAYQRRDTVGLVVFRASAAEVVLPPTSSVEVAARRLRDLRTGGRTPLAEGLHAAHRLLATASLRDPARRPLLVLVTDGRATHGKDAVARSRGAAAGLAAAGTASVVVDCEPTGPGAVRLRLAETLAAVLGAEHLALGELAGDRALAAATECLTGAVRHRTDTKRRAA